MNDVHSIAALLGLRADSDTSKQELDRALSDLHASVAAGQSVASAIGGAQATALGIQSVAQTLAATGRTDLAARLGVFAHGAEEVLAPNATTRMLVNVRTTPIAAADPLAPAWRRAMKPGASRGPFVNATGVRFWIDTFALPQLVTIVAQIGIAPTPRVIARVALKRSVRPGGRRSIAAGSVWIAANALVKGRPDNEFVGVRVRGGTLDLTGVGSATANVITLVGAWQAKLALKLDPPPNPTPGSDPGADASHASVTLPATATFTFAAGSAPAIDVADANGTAFDTDIAFTRSNDAPLYDDLSRSIVIPMTASRDRFDFVAVRSNTMKLDGGAPIARSGWGLLTIITTPDTLGDALGAGFMWLDLTGALRARWTGLSTRALVPHSALGLAPGSIALWGELVAADVTHHLRLWDEPASSPLRQSSVDITSVAGSTLFYLTQPDSEAVVFMGEVVAHFDRPLEADGGRLPIAMPLGWLVITELPDATTVSVLALDSASLSAPHIAFALENALIKSRPPVWLLLFGTLQADIVSTGLVLLFEPYRAIVPTLPDPYAANFDYDRRRDVDAGWLTAIIIWATQDIANLAFAAQSNDGAVISVQAAPDPLAARFNEFPKIVLVDVSSNADQFGVAIPVASKSVALQGLSVVSPASDVAVVTLPPISWEPMFTSGPIGGDPPLPPPPHDGGIATLSAMSPIVGAIEPLPLISTYNDEVHRDRHFTATLPLPFGLIAHLDTRAISDEPQSKFIGDGNAMFFNQPKFANGVAGGTQLAIAGPPNTIPDSRDRPLPGWVELVSENDYAKGVLSENIHTAFGEDFGSFGLSVPVRRYELSGYGASMRSDWRDPEAVGPAIIEARFDVYVGRTAHEVIQMQSVLHPWWIKVVRTITMDRQRGGWILREDSGWVASSDGRFAYAGDPNALLPQFQQAAFGAADRHPGAIEALVNVRNIQLDGAQFTLPPAGGANAVVWQAVTFYADVVFVASDNPRLVVLGGSAAGRCASRGITGWIQIDGPKYDTKAKDGSIVHRIASASATDVFGLLAVKGPARAPIGCGLSFGGSDAKPALAVRATSVDVSCADDAVVPRLVAAVRGSPTLPRDGAWSLSRIRIGEPAPTALDPSFAVPVVRPTSPTPGFDRWHMADPGDIRALEANPATRYAMVQSLGTQKVYFERPRVDNAADPIHLPNPPKLADMGALLNASGVFPGLADAFDFKTLKALSANAGDIAFTETFPIGSGIDKEALLADLGAIQVVIEYHDEHESDVLPAKGGPNPTLATVTVDPAAAIRWSLLLTRVCFAVRYNKSPLISIFADVKADAASAPIVANVNVRYEGILGALQSIFTNIQQVARFLPGGADAGLKVGFSQGHLTVRNAFALPSLPLGTGQITDIAVDMGFDVALSPFDVRFVAGLGSSQNPFHWIVSPLAGTGCVQVAIGNKGLDVLVQGGLGLGLAIDLGIASGSASVALAMELNTDPDPFEIKAILSGRASVDVLQGLASATITLAAGLGIVPPPQLFKPPFLPPSIPPTEIPSLTITLIASVAAGIHLSVCWVVDVDWDGYWQFRQDISTPAIPVPL